MAAHLGGVGSSSWRADGSLDPSKLREFTPAEEQEFRQLGVLMKSLMEQKAAAAQQQQAAEKRLKEATERRLEASSRLDSASERRQDASERRQDATRRVEAADRAAVHFQNAGQLADKAAAASQERDKLVKEATDHGAAAKQHEVEGDRLMMVSALTRMIFPHISTNTPATKRDEITRARQLVEGTYSGQIVDSRAKDRWTTVVSKGCPRLTEGAIQDLIIPVISDTRLPNAANGLTLDLGGFKDELDVAPTAKFIVDTARLRKITFGELSSDQLSALATGVVRFARAMEPNFIQFTSEAIAAQFKDKLAAAKSLTSSPAAQPASAASAASAAAPRKPLPPAPKRASPAVTTVAATSTTTANAQGPSGSPPRNVA